MINTTGAPTYATQPVIGAPHDLRQIELTAAALGTPLMPWQRLVSRVASERFPDDPEKFKYHTIILTVPRQSGKTTLMRTVLTQRAIVNYNRQAFYTAQTGKDATARWKDLIKQIEGSVFAPFVTTKLAQGSQSCQLPNGSSIAPFAPTPKSLHGYTPHDVMLDEIFEWDTEQGEALLGAVKPAQITLKSRQLWLVSTMGTEDSEFLNAQIEIGRAAVNNPESGIAYFEWSLAEGLDSTDPQNWGFHPAVGHTIEISDLAESMGSHSVGEWERAYMNRRTKAIQKWVSDDVLAQVMAEPTAPPTAKDIHLSFDVDPKQGGGGAIVAAWPGEPGKVSAKIFKLDTGRSWIDSGITAALSVRANSFKYDNTAINRHYAGNHDDEFLDPVNTGDFTTSCMMLLEYLESGRLVVEDTEAMRDALQNVVTRPLGEGWAISRKKSAGDVSAAVALAIALKSAAHDRVEAAPMIRF